MTGRPPVTFRSGGHSMHTDPRPLPTRRERLDGFLRGTAMTEVTYGSEWAEGNLEYNDTVLMHHWMAARGEPIDLENDVYETALSVLDNFHRGGFDPVHVDFEIEGDVIALSQFMAALRITGTTYKIVRQ